jgi:RNA polymerase sigma-70 factor, ECF subfamily
MDMGQLDELYRRFGPLVFRRARTLLGDEQAALDAMQEVFMRTLRSHEAFRNEASPTTWLYRITTNYCLNVLRDSSRHRQRLAERTAPQPRDSGATGLDPEVPFLLAEILERLPVELCEIATYYYVDCLSHDEIADVIGTSRRTVGNRLREFHRRADALFRLEKEVLA